MQLNPYIMFNGNCEEALKFYEETLGAKIDSLMKNAGSPAAEHVPADWGDKVLHARFSVDGNVLMASDAPPGHYSQPQGFSISISLNDTTKGEEVFNKLSAGGSVQMPFSPTFWAKGFGMCVDRFGIPWMVNCE
jgi:PhnB protein